MNSIQFQPAFVLAILVLAAWSQTCYGQCKTTEELDECAFKADIFMNRELKIPQSVDDIKAHCEFAKKSIACMSDFNENCVFGPPQMFLKKIYSSAKDKLDDRCNDDDKIADFLDNLKCLDNKDKIETVRRCADKNIVMLNKVSEFDSLPDRPGALCCTFSSFKECMLIKVKDICGDSQADYFQRLISEHADELIVATCDRFNSLDKCGANLGAPMWTALKPLMEADADNDMFRHSFKSPVPIMMKLLDKFLKKSK